jgi:hypothetical protein
MKLAAFPQQSYAIGKDKVGRAFLDQLLAEFQKLLRREINADQLLLFIMVILQRDPNVRTGSAIRKRIAHRLRSWAEGKIDMLVEDTEADLKKLLKSTRGGAVTSKQRYKRFHHLLIHKGITEAMAYIGNCEKGALLFPDDIDEKTGEPVADVLRSKHPKATKPPDLPDLGPMPELVTVDITPEMVADCAKTLRGAAGLGGSETSEVRRWFTAFGDRSRALCRVVAELGSWMANGLVPWAAIRALRAGRLIGLDKFPGVRPVGIGDVFMRLIAKSHLAAAGYNATLACGSDQLFRTSAGTSRAESVLRLSALQPDAFMVLGFPPDTSARPLNGRMALASDSGPPCPMPRSPEYRLVRSGERNPRSLGL